MRRSLLGRKFAERKGEYSRCLEVVNPKVLKTVWRFHYERCYNPDVSGPQPLYRIKKLCCKDKERSLVQFDGRTAFHRL